MILKILTVIALATFEIYVAIATGLGFGFDKWTILLCTLAGGIAGVFIAVFLGQKIEHFITKTFKKNKEPKPKTGIIYKIWDKYGLYGLGLIGTFFLGAPAAIGVGVGFNADLKKLMPLCLIAVVARCFAFTFLGNLIKGLF
jgi:membrane protein YqaA with SNARE-associated domain